MNRFLVGAVSAAAVLATSGGVALGLTDQHPHHSTRTAHTAHTFGPDGYDGVALGMTRAQARAAGVTVRRANGESCSAMLLPRAKRARGRVDGWLSSKVGVALIATTDRDAHTPEGMRIGMTRAQVHRIYPKAENNTDFWAVAVPGHRGAYYWWGYQHGRVGALTIALGTQDCVN